MGPEHGSGVAVLLHHADVALYYAKGRREGSLRFFEPGMATPSIVRRKAETELRTAFQSGTLEVDFQPIVSLRSMRPTSCEALIRWPAANDEMKSPAQFIPLAEEMGIISDVGAWVLRRACGECSKWPDGISVAVNVSKLQLREPNLHLVVAEALAASALSPRRLQIEIPEDVVHEDFSSTRTAVDQLRTMGVAVCVDNFGTGYSGLSWLQDLLIDKIKIDRSFVSNLPTDTRSVRLLRGITKLCSEIDIAVGVKGIETQIQADIIAAEADIDEVQGFLFSSAISAPRVEELLARYHADRQPFTRLTQ